VIDLKCQQGCTQTYNACVKDWNPADHPKGTLSPCDRNENTCLQARPRTGGGPGPMPTAQIAALFHSAEDTIKMWEKVQSALLITSTSSSYGQIGVPYTETLSARAGAPPYTWSIQNGSSLPPGLTLNQNATISGTGTTPGPYGFTVVVQDSSIPQPSDLSSGFQHGYVARAVNASTELSSARIPTCCGPTRPLPQQMTTILDFASASAGGAEWFAPYRQRAELDKPLEIDRYVDHA
jgi:hypothetical protein